MFPGHPNLLPAYFEDDPQAAELGNSYVRKPLYSREGANVTLVGRRRARSRSRTAPMAPRLHPPGLRATAEFRRRISR